MLVILASRLHEFGSNFCPQLQGDEPESPMAAFTTHRSGFALCEGCEDAAFLS
ncbi:unnamed protein product [Prunus armeniaca]|uniref:Uncharacterized protein n=1 Tax=Prunus armeniaca TaxID=36596 RepID=A0A6J5WMS3_PRUAR|nr:unnamed protein product [Prunus armeniaca]